MIEYYWARAQEAVARGDLDDYLRWMLKHDEAIREAKEVANAHP